MAEPKIPGPALQRSSPRAPGPPSAGRSPLSAGPPPTAARTGVCVWGVWSLGRPGRVPRPRPAQEPLPAPAPRPPGPAPGLTCMLCMVSRSWSSWWAELRASRRMSVSFISFSHSSERSSDTSFFSGSSSSLPWNSRAWGAGGAGPLEGGRERRALAAEPAGDGNRPHCPERGLQWGTLTRGRRCPRRTRRRT